MRNHPIALVAGVFAVTFAPVWLAEAQARMPLALEDADTTADATAPSAHAESPPEAFEDKGELGYEPNPTVDRSGPRLQCVPFARMVSGVEIYGNANTWWVQAAGAFERDREPEVGAVITMRGYNTNTRGHVAVVQEVISERVVLIDHANWLNSGEVTRAVPVRDVSPAGDWSQVQVWHVPGGHWGGRVYRVQGFILPRGHDETEAATAPADPAGAAAG